VILTSLNITQMISDIYNRPVYEITVLSTLLPRTTFTVILPLCRLSAKLSKNYNEYLRNESCHTTALIHIIRPTILNGGRIDLNQRCSTPSPVSTGMGVLHVFQLALTDICLGM